VADELPQKTPADIAIATSGQLRIGRAADMVLSCAEANYHAPVRFLERQIIAARRAGRPLLLVVFGSNAAFGGNIGAEAYAAEKLALLKYCELRRRTARTDQVRIMYLAFGGIWTPFWEKACASAPPALVAAIRPDPLKALTVAEVCQTVQTLIELPAHVAVGHALITSTEYQ
jgi:NAD(P)-dependent dehydrogenase (short-subunit alcohol dehydrogenase family)